MWKTLAKKLTIDIPKRAVVVKPTSHDFRKFEGRYNFKFPKSYVTFIEEFGGGTLNHYFLIYAPLGSGSISLNSIAKAQGDETLIDVYGNEDFIRRMIPFADTIGGDIFVWDPSKKRKGADEYEIFALPRDREEIIRVATSFRRFILGVCLGRDFEDLVLGQRDPEWGIDYIYRPDAKKSVRR